MSSDISLCFFFSQRVLIVSTQSLFDRLAWALDSMLEISNTVILQIGDIVLVEEAMILAVKLAKDPSEELDDEVIPRQLRDMVLTQLHTQKLWYERSHL